MNNTRNTVAEFMEGRVLTKGNSQQRARIQAQDWEHTMSRLLAVRKAAKKDRKQQFTNLYHHINYTIILMRACLNKVFSNSSSSQLQDAIM